MKIDYLDLHLINWLKKVNKDYIVMDFMNVLMDYLFSYSCVFSLTLFSDKQLYYAIFGLSALQVEAFFFF